MLLLFKFSYAINYRNGDKCQSCCHPIVKKEGEVGVRFSTRNVDQDKLTYPIPLSLYIPRQWPSKLTIERGYILKIETGYYGIIMYAKNHIAIFKAPMAIPLRLAGQTLPLFKGEDLSTQEGNVLDRNRMD